MAAHALIQIRAVSSVGPKNATSTLQYLQLPYVWMSKYVNVYVCMITSLQLPVYLHAPQKPNTENPSRLHMVIA